MRISCTDGPCLSPGSAVEVVLAWEVPLPWLPGTLAADVPARIPVEARQRVPDRRLPRRRDAVMPQ